MSKGFTLVETIVAVGLLALVIVGTIPLLNISTSMIQQSGEISQETYSEDAPPGLLEAEDIDLDVEESFFEVEVNAIDVSVKLGTH